MAEAKLTMTKPMFTKFQWDISFTRPNGLCFGCYVSRQATNILAKLSATQYNSFVFLRAYSPVHSLGFAYSILYLSYEQ
ncbi:hypothetical protein Dimus_035501 [Dionaea muscipula]